MPSPNDPEVGSDITTIRGLSAFLIQRLSDMEKLNQERDKRYGERHDANEKAVAAAFAANKEAVAAAFSAAKEAVGAALAAAKEAVVKAEEAQRQYNDSHNGLLKKIDEQHKETMPRQEIEGRFTRLDEKIEDLKREGHAQSNLNTGRVITIVLASVGIAVGIIEFFLRSQ